LVHGNAILDFLNEQHTRDRLFQAAEDGKPPIACIERDLAAKFGQLVAQSPVEEFICMAIHLIMKEAGYQPAVQKRIGRSQLCWPDLVHAKVAVKEDPPADSLWARICGLNEAQLVHLISAASVAMAPIETPEEEYGVLRLMDPDVFS
jgi:hypothetical protein